MSGVPRNAARRGRGMSEGSDRDERAPRADRRRRAGRSGPAGASSPDRSAATWGSSSPWSILCIVGVVTAGDRFADVDNVLTILRLAAVIGVVSVGMTFVIIGGGIDLSVGALVALVVGLGHHAGHPADGRGHPLDRHGLHRARWWARAPGWSTAC